MHQVVWSRYVVIGLGFWLLANIPTFEISHFPTALCDAISGFLLIFFGWISLNEKRKAAPWIIALIGVWMQLYPLIYHSPNAFSYANDTLVGVLAITFAVIIPGLPGLLEFSDATPSGWSYNPSAWTQRLPIAALAFFGWMVTRYMAAYQLGFIHTIYDPIFPNGTLNVVTSTISKSIPISDAGLGAVGFSLVMLMACMGDSQRWRTMPWLVIFFGILVFVLGSVSILYVLCQPLVIGSWCAWCLATTIIMLGMILLAIDEVWAALHYIRGCLKAGETFAHAFWHGAKSEERIQAQVEGIEKLYVKSIKTGVSVPFNLVLSALMGIYLMMAPALYGITGSLQDLDHIAGSFVTVVSIVTMAEVVRAWRLLNIILGAVLILVTWYAFPQDENTIQTMALGALIILLSLRRGPIHEKYGQ